MGKDIPKWKEMSYFLYKNTNSNGNSVVWEYWNLHFLSPPSEKALSGSKKVSLLSIIMGICPLFKGRLILLVVVVQLKIYS